MVKVWCMEVEGRMTVYVEVPYYGTIAIDEGMHHKLKSTLKYDIAGNIIGRRLTLWRKAVSELMRQYRIVVPAISFSEWLFMAYKNKRYYVYKRFQVVKILYQPESKTSRKSPLPFADARAWEYKQFWGDDADDEIEEARGFRWVSAEIYPHLEKEAMIAMGLIGSIVCAFYHGSVVEITDAVEDELVDEDEVPDIDVIHRAVILYRHWEDIREVMTRAISDEEQVREMMWFIERTRGVGMYVDEDLDRFEEALREAYQEITGEKIGKQEFHDLLYELVENGEWGYLITLHEKGTGFKCKLGFSWRVG